MMIEKLAALVTAVEAWRARGDDLAMSYLRWRGDIREVIANERWDADEFWGNLVRYPGHGALRSIGLTGAEATEFARAADDTFQLVRLGVEWARVFFTTEMQRVYARFKHGFSLLSPLSAPVAIDTEFTPRAASTIFNASLLVLDQVRKNDAPVLFAMRCTGYDLGRVQQAAAMIATPVRFLSASLVIEARAANHRGIILLTPDLAPLNEAQRRASEVYMGVERGSGRYSFHEHDEVIRLQRRLETAGERYSPYPLPPFGET